MAAIDPITTTATMAIVATTANLVSHGNSAQIIKEMIEMAATETKVTVTTETMTTEEKTSPEENDPKIDGAMAAFWTEGIAGSLFAPWSSTQTSTSTGGLLA